MTEKSLFAFCFILILSGSQSCKECPKNPPSAMYIHYGVCSEYNEYLFLNTLPDTTFYFTGPGMYPGSVICGHWKRHDDSLLLSVEYPFTYKIKKSFQHYENYHSRDSLYFMFFGLNPKIEHFNPIYPSIQTELLLDSSEDTLPTALSFSTRRLKGWTFDDTVIVHKTVYNGRLQDTIEISLDHLTGIIDSSVPVSFVNTNCVKIYLSKGPVFSSHYYDLPTKYLVKKNKFIAFDEKHEKITFIKMKD